MTSGTLRTLAGWVAALCLSAQAVELARFEIREPLGRTWPDEWLTQGLRVDLGDRYLHIYDLRLQTSGGEALPAQFYLAPEGRPLDLNESITGSVPLKVLFRASIPKDATTTFRLTDDGGGQRAWKAIYPSTFTWSETDPEEGGRGGGGWFTYINNAGYTVWFGKDRDLPFSHISCGKGSGRVVECRWPAGLRPRLEKEEWLEKGPVRALVRRVFRFDDPALRYDITFDLRAGDPWIDITEDYALGKGSAITIGLKRIEPDVVFHPYTYNARTFGTGGPEEDSTIEPPQHPIATLGPVWRDIWFGGGPYAFIYNSKSDAGIGFAAVRGSEWDTPEGVSPESQNLEVHGDRERPGQVWVRLPTDGGKRRWAIVVGPAELRKKMAQLVVARADLPLDKVLREWILDWKSDAKPVTYGFAGVWLGAPFNRHELNPTTFPRRVGAALDGFFKEGKVKSRDLAILAYVFTDPNYWPGPKYKWTIGNPNFHTDMYPIPLKIGLLMPDHPHAKRWVQYGIDEMKGNLLRDSYPGGAWQESLGYSAFFFHIVECAKRVRDAEIMDPFKQWHRFREVATYLACMHTPVDPRYGVRQIAPIGDTSPGNYIAELRRVAECYRGVDGRLAEQLGRFPEKWSDALDLRSREFQGFGAMLRGNPYDDRNESFVTIKAGPARNHYQGDELSFHFCGLATPLALDYACHYSPRPWSASMHNRPDLNGRRPVAIAVRRACAASPVADVFVADERTARIHEVPMEPHKLTKPGSEYPVTTLPDGHAWTMRRYALLVKHDPKTSRIADYLVIRDEISSPEPVWWNLHMLARDIQQDGQRFLFPGQLDVDATVHFLAPEVGETETREWGWSIERTKGTRRTLRGEAYEKEHFGHVIPKDFVRGTWGKDFASSGEMGKWLRVKGAAGRTDWLVLLVPHLQGTPAPRVEKLSATSARIALGDESEIVHLGSDGKHQAAVERDGKTTTLLGAGHVKPWSELEFTSGSAK